jgi:hypothetical protein
MGTEQLLVSCSWLRVMSPYSRSALIFNYSACILVLHYSYGLGIPSGGEEHAWFLTSPNWKREWRPGKRKWVRSIGSERAVWRPRLIRGLATSQCIRTWSSWTRRQSVLFLQTAALQTAVPGESVDLVGNNQYIIVPLKVLKINPKITVTVRRNNTCLPCHTISVQNLV